jgi:biuret amidohydrolase
MKALLSIDLIKEIVHPDGKLSGKGYSDYAFRHNTLSNIREVYAKARTSKLLLVHVKLGYSSSYSEHSADSLLLGGAKSFRALQLDSWGTEFVEAAMPEEGESVIIKHRISAFYGTNLEILLRAHAIDEIYIVGVATDLAVESAARDAHDRDYSVTVISDCCVAASDADHLNSCKTLKKISNVVTIDECVF